MASINLQWAAPKELDFSAEDLRDAYLKFEEHWNLFEKTELRTVQKKTNVHTSSCVLAKKGERFTKPCHYRQKLLPTRAGGQCGKERQRNSRMLSRAIANQEKI